MVIGGGVSESAPLFLDEAREHYAARLTGARQPPARPDPRRPARRGGRGGGRGGAGPRARAGPVSALASDSELRAVVVLVALVRRSGPQPQHQPAQPGRQREQAQRQAVDVRDADPFGAMMRTRPRTSSVIPTAAGGPMRGSGGGSGGMKCSKRSVSGSYGRCAGPGGTGGAANGGVRGGSIGGRSSPGQVGTAPSRRHPATIASNSSAAGSGPLGSSGSRFTRPPTPLVPPGTSS